MIRRHLENTQARVQSFDEVVIEAVGDYMAFLMAEGFIPHHQLDATEEVLIEEAWDIMRKITYGSVSLSDYRNQKDRQTQRKKMNC